MFFKPFTIGYKIIDEELVVLLYGRDENGDGKTLRLKGTEPYFFVPSGSNHPQAKEITRIEYDAATSLRGEKLDCVYTKYPFEVYKAREHYKTTYEADISYAQRIRYDFGIKSVIEVPNGMVDLSPSDIKAVNDDPLSPSVVIEPRWAAYDIETYDKGTFKGPEDPRAPVVSITAWDSKTDAYICIFNGRLKSEDELTIVKEANDMGWNVQTLCVGTEENLFRAFRQWLLKTKQDVVVTWNGGWNCRDFSRYNSHIRPFDNPYLAERAKILGVDNPIPRSVAFFDAMDAYAYLHEGMLPSMSLQYVSEEIFGLRGKTTKKRIWQMMEGGPGGRGELLVYNINDVWLTKEIVLRKDMLNYFLLLCDFAGTNIEACLSMGRLSDSYVFHALKSENVKRPTKVTKKWNKVKGANVFEPSTGVYEDVFEADLSGAYPATVMTFNISPETILEEDEESDDCIVTPNGNRYRKDKRGIIPRIVEDLTRLRQRTKAEKNAGGDASKDLVVKFFINALSYGNLASPTFRDGDPRLGNDITAFTRELIFWTDEKAREWAPTRGTELELRAGDTDSVYLSVVSGRPDDLEAFADELCEHLNETFYEFSQQYGANDHYLNIEKEHVYDRFAQAGTKKRYAAIYKDPKGELVKDGINYSMKVRGLEIRKSNVALITKTAQSGVLERILFGESRTTIIEFVYSLIEGLRSGSIPVEQAGLPGLFNKQEPWFTAGQFSNRYLGKEYGRGDKPLVYFGHIEGKPRTGVFALDWGEEVPSEAVINWDRTIERVVLGPLGDILELASIRPEDCLEPVEEFEEYF